MSSVAIDVLAISGDTADTLAAVREAKACGVATLRIRDSRATWPSPVSRPRAEGPCGRGACRGALEEDAAPCSSGDGGLAYGGIAGVGLWVVVYEDRGMGAQCG